MHSYICLARQRKMLRKSPLLILLLIAATVAIGESSAVYLQKVGCYNQYSIKGLKYLFSERSNIDWRNGDFRHFVTSFALKCKKETEKLGYEMFAIVFYGECWGIKSASQLSKATKVSKCTLGDNTYKTCNGEKETLCVGGSGTAYVYTSTDLASYTAPKHATNVPKCPLFLFKKVGCFDSRTNPISSMKKVSYKNGHTHGHKHKRKHRHDQVYRYDLDVDIDLEYNDPHGRHKHGPHGHKHGHKYGHKHGKNPTRAEILCHCSEEAMKGEYTYFSIRSFKYCMLGDQYNAMIRATSKRRSTNCYDEQNRRCNDKDSNNCVGGNGADYVYMIDFCLLHNGGCQHDCSFNGVTKSVICSCKTGFMLGEDGRTCTDKNECRTGNKGGCTHTCVNTAGSYKCSCPGGYILLQDRRTCQDINECRTRSKGGCTHTCENTAGSYKCSCPSGYILSIDGKTCKDVDECLSSNDCEQECVNTMGSYKCKCKNGYKLDANGKTCSDIDECLTKNGGCTDKCINVKGGFECRCKQGFQLLEDEKTCEDIDECKTVANGGCHHKCSNFKGGFVCVCLSGYQLTSNGKNCTDVDECGNLNGGCSHICTNSKGSFKCSCPDGFIIDGKQCYDIDECANSDKGGCAADCVNVIGSFYCTCGKGYVLGANKKSCEAKQTKWPRGSYGILSRERCPPGWFEFTHCLDTQDLGNADNMNKFTLGFYPSYYTGNTDCASSFVTFRYCFKGPNVPSRSGGFWTTNGATGEGYVIKNTLDNGESDCSIFGQEGGSVQMDTEDFWNKDTYGNYGLNERYYPLYHPNDFNFGDLSYVTLQFCRIGAAKKDATATVMEIGEFPNKFGFFIHRDATCPILKGPSGYLQGHREEFTMDFEDSFNLNKVAPPAPFVQVGKGNFDIVVCQYDPKKGNESI